MKKMDNIDKFHNDKDFRDKIAHNILSKIIKDKHPEMKEYRWDDGFWIFSDSEEAAEQRHQEWLERGCGGTQPPPGSSVSRGRVTCGE